jgi:hypothetical protein
MIQLLIFCHGAAVDGVQRGDGGPKVPGRYVLRRKRVQSFSSQILGSVLMPDESSKSLLFPLIPIAHGASYSNTTPIFRLEARPPPIRCSAIFHSEYCVVA